MGGTTTRVSGAWVRGGLVALAAAGLAGCGKGKEPPGKATPVAVAATVSKPKTGGNVRLPSNEPRYLNPLIEQRFDLANTILFEGLVGVDARGEPVPRLAASWTQSPDGLVVTFKLQPKATWHDGQPVTAADVAFSFDQAKKTAWKAYMEPVVKIETPDPQTVVVTYGQPYAPAMAAWTMAIIPAHIYRGDDDLTQSKGNREGIGSGPFKLVRWEGGRRIVLAAHDGWWGGRPYLDNIELVLGVSDGEMLSQLRRDQLDWAPIRIVDDQMTLAQSPELREEFEQSDAVESRLRLIAWNTDRPGLEDKRVRQALTMALDRQRVIEDVLGGRAQPLSGPFFPTMAGADPSIAPLPFDLARAKALIDEALPAKPGATGPRLTVELILRDSLRGPVVDSTFAIFRRDLEKIGVDIKLTALPPAEHDARISKREFDATYFGWLPDIPDPDPYALLHSSQIGVGFNYAGYANPEIDRMLDEARHATNRDARRVLYAKVHAVVADEQPYTPLYSPIGYYAWRRSLHGVGARDLAPQPLAPGVARWWVGR